MKPIHALLMPMVVTAELAACAARPRETPLPIAPIETGDQTVEYARRQLEGTWELQRFEVIEAARSRDVRARARLTYDAYGNLAVEGAVLEGEQPNAPHPLLNYSGRIVIDPVRKEFRLMDVRGERPDDAEVRKILTPSNVRRYGFEDGRLVLLLVAEDGTPTARATFAKTR